MNYKKVLNGITVVFIGVMLFLTFFSRTLSDLYVPRVTIDFVSPGIISPEARSSGIVRPTDTDDHFYIEASFPQAHDFISLNQSAEIFAGTERLTGRTTRIVHAGDRNIVTIEVQSGELNGGEMVSVIISGGSSNHANVIPLSAFREDIDGYFILYVESVPQRFGTHYYLRVQRIESSRRDISNIAINPVWGMSLTENPIVKNSDIPVHAGVRVRIVGEANFSGAR